ncbi:MAG: DNA-formamidopyrimidine glycosylase family protein [Pseudomonadota bacterium]
MPEGHTIHREARDQRAMVTGKPCLVSSPQGRFADGARLLDGATCETVEALGKHLLYRFQGDRTLHIHLGLFGRIRKRKVPPAEPRGAVRVRLESPTHVVDINGPTICEILDPAERESLFARIGPDVLRADADPDRAFHRISRSRAPIGRLIMDQSVMAGIGNIYRTEILWRQRLHPDLPGRDIDRSVFDRLWSDAVTLLALGVKRNAIITVDNPPKTRKGGERFNIFGKDECPSCRTSIQRIEIDNRRAFLCPACQSLP